MSAYRQWIVGVLLAMLPWLSVACSKTFRGSVSQPNPLRTPNETLRESEQVVIVTGDMELSMPRSSIPRSSASTGDSVWVNERYPLNNRASFTVVSRDRLRFHVQIEHKWKDWADLSTWKVYLVDDHGRRYRPEALNGGQPVHLVSMWDYESRTAIRNRFGDIVAILDDGYRRRKPLGSLSVFRGRGDFVFYGRDIFTPEVERLTLVLERGTLAFSFTWKFTEEDSAPDGDGPVLPGSR